MIFWSYFERLLTTTYRHLVFKVNKNALSEVQEWS